MSPVADQAKASRPKKKKKLKPQKFGRYLLLDRIASGGMAEVWRAKIFGAEDFQRIVAIKKILAHVAEDQDFITMFKDEAKITVLLQHANIGQVYELGKIDDVYFIAMEYVGGKDCKTIWQHQRQQKQNLPINLCCYVMQNIAEGLDYAHRKKDNFGVDLKIVHRDVSPQNILVSWEGEIKMIDFGIAKAAGKASRTQAGILKGKFGYMAPEQVRGLPLDQRADVFAMGVCLYELLTGQRAFQAESDFSLLEQVRNVELAPPTLVNKHIPHELEQIIYKALAKDPEDRYQWASDFSEALQRFLIMQGKPPNRMDMGQYLRENFTVDYDRERLRMEAFRDIEMPEDPPEPAAAPQPASVPPELDRGSAAVMAALREDGGGGGSLAPDESSGAFASYNDGSAAVTAPISTQGGSNVGPAPQSPGFHSAATNPAIQPAPLVGGSTIRPALQPLPSDLLTGESSGGSALKYLGISLGALVGTVVIGLIMYVALVGKGTLIVSTEPHDVQIILDGTPVGRTENGSLTVADVSAKIHDLAAQREGYIPHSEKVTVSKDTTKNIFIKLGKMAAQTGKLDVISAPPGAAIFLDGRDTKLVTPAVIEDVVASEEHTVTLKLEDFAELEQKFSTTPDETKRLELELQALYVVVSIKTIPEGGKVYLNGTLKGEAPIKIKRLDPDDPPPKLVIKRRGCQDYQTSLAISSEEPYKSEVIKLKCR